MTPSVINSLDKKKLLLKWQLCASQCFHSYLYFIDCENYYTEGLNGSFKWVWIEQLRFQSEFLWIYKSLVFSKKDLNEIYEGLNIDFFFKLYWLLLEKKQGWFRILQLLGLLDKTHLSALGGLEAYALVHCLTANLIFSTAHTMKACYNRDLVSNILLPWFLAVYFCSPESSWCLWFPCYRAPGPSAAKVSMGLREQQGQLWRIAEEGTDNVVWLHATWSSIPSLAGSDLPEARSSLFVGWIWPQGCGVFYNTLNKVGSRAVKLQTFVSTLRKLTSRRGQMSPEDGENCCFLLWIWEVCKQICSSLIRFGVVLFLKPFFLS